MDFKAFYGHAKRGTNFRALVIVPNVPAREALKTQLSNEAADARVPIIFRNSENTMFAGDNALLAIRVAHAKLDRQLAGLEWHAIWGLHHLTAWGDEGERASAYLQAMVGRG